MYICMVIPPVQHTESPVLAQHTGDLTRSDSGVCQRSCGREIHGWQGAPWIHNEFVPVAAETQSEK